MSTAFLSPQGVAASRLSDEVARRLVGMIREGLSTSSGRLPPSHQLARMLGVSRSTLREALRTLEAMGVVSIRHGSGIYVRSGDPLDGVWSSRWMRWLLRHGASLEEVLQVREAVEAQAASLAASRATAKAVQRLERLLAEGDALVASYRGRPVDEGLLEAYVRLDEAFHDTLAQLAGYRFLRNLLHALASAIADSRAATLAIPGRIQRSLREHRAILRAVSRRDPEAARRAMRAHVRRVLAEVRSVRHHPSRPLSAKQT